MCDVSIKKKLLLTYFIRKFVCVKAMWLRAIFPPEEVSESFLSKQKEILQQFFTVFSPVSSFFCCFKVLLKITLKHTKCYFKVMLQGLIKTEMQSHSPCLIYLKNSEHTEYAMLIHHANLWLFHTLANEAKAGVAQWILHAPIHIMSFKLGHYFSANIRSVNIQIYR